MTWVIKQAAIKAAKPAIMAVRKAEAPANIARPSPIMPKGGPVLKQSTLNWKSPDKYQEFATLKSK